MFLCKNGDLYACVDTNGIIKLNRTSELIWHTDGEDLLHHDFFVDTTGMVYAIGRRVGIIPEIDPVKEVIDDTVVLFDSTGKRIKRFSIYNAFRGTEWFPAITKKVRDFVALTVHDSKIPVETFHTNTIEVFDGSLSNVSPLLRKGNAVFCSPVHPCIFIIDLERERVVWNWFGPWKGGIHQPTFLPNGNYLLFHNGLSPDGPEDEASHVFEYAYPEQGPVWQVSGNDPKHKFFSLFSCTAERLANENTLIVVSNEGKAIEVTKEGEVVWEFWNPNTVGADMAGMKGFTNRKDGRIIGTLFQLERVPRDVHDSWLNPAKEP
ncbi:MAG: hypothetical protein K1Y02_02565 [Candidatus Hydrogenedentes bacterium]|nr:hypothetical protein [Candidatus Hydrogenedentota bacterium]